MIALGTFLVPQDRQALWKALDLQRMWAAQYPRLFDEEDLRLATGRQGVRGFHFVDWLGAIIVSTITGYDALVSKYQYPRHARKRQVVAALGLTNVLRLRQPRFGGTQGPDLLMYRPDYSDFFFCEVKGPGDALRGRQNPYFRHLENETGRRIRLLRLGWAKEPRVGA